ncbi:MAG: type II toxin-antitoxin system PemK/MazF family toxin [Verrucomicrobiaceae bacterium]|nr:type II toxin-antitoxin system PemK/MazF family toxin [Verrucomicrobiaceae bacterium]
MAGRIKRGDIWLVDLGLAAKVRPGLILSVEFRDDERALYTYVARTTTLRGGRFEVSHTAALFKPGAFDAQNLGSVPEPKLIKLLGRVSDHTLEQVEAAVAGWLSIRQAA